MTGSRSDAPLDLLAVGAHPDDVELFAGGTLALLAARGRRVGILALTRGECGTRGTPETREQESEKAAKILNVSCRETLDLGDGRLENSHENRIEVVGALRRLAPIVVLTHSAEERHPDHGRAHRLVRDACFLANVGGFEAEGERHQVAELAYFFGHEAGAMPRPDWIVDITETYEARLRAVQAYSTQFHAPDDRTEGPSTYISSSDFAEVTEARARHWGHVIGARYGEPFTLHRPAHAGHAFVSML